AGHRVGVDGRRAAPDAGSREARVMRALAALTRTLGPAVEAGWHPVGEETCPACEGEGAYEALDHERTQPWPSAPTYSEFPCEACGGSGRARRVVITIRPAATLVDAPKPQAIPTGTGEGHDDHSLPW